MSDQNLPLKRSGKPASPRHEPLDQRVLQLLGQKNYTPANVPELLRFLHLPPKRQQELQQALQQLEHSGQIARVKGNRYIKPLEADLIPGRISINRSGRGFLRPDDDNLGEISISESDTSTAMNGDRVLVRLNVKAKGLRESTEQPTGKVIRILDRKRLRIVGTLQRGRSFLYVIPDDPRFPHDVYVPEPRDVGRPANIGDKVVVEMKEWESRHTNPEGEIVEILGAPDAEGVDMLSVLRQYNLPLSFPHEVLAEARAYGNAVKPEEIAGREDCREHLVITIDPDDAKDFDDAICLQRVSQTQWKLWVHIADVSHYVKPGTQLDDQARKRGNSTYLVDRVIPMLPEALSNELCSLKPHVDRLTKCVEFLVSDDGRVLKSRFYPAVIHSHRRFTYQEVLAILQREPADDDIERMLHHAHQLAQKIRRLRFANGSLELDFPETKIRLDEKGKVLRLEKMENDVSHQLIEEYMLLANEAVAGELMRRNTPAIYRVHEEPDPKRLAEYREDVLSQNIPCGNLGKKEEIQKLMAKLKDLPIGPALKIGFLKSLMRARYAMEPLGHYGLAKEKYAHFTSPIRRYADLVVHRALFETGHGKQHSLKETSEHISETERNSADAERDSKDVKMYAYLRAQLEMETPPRYPALVTDVRNFGFFVDVTGLAMSGLVPLSSIEDDFYVFDSQRNNLVGRRFRKVIRLGDKVEVQIAKVDSFKKQVDFKLATDAKAAKPKGKFAQESARSRPSQRGYEQSQPERPGKFGKSDRFSKPERRGKFSERPERSGKFSDRQDRGGKFSDRPSGHGKPSRSQDHSSRSKRPSGQGGGGSKRTLPSSSSQFMSAQGSRAPLPSSSSSFGRSGGSRGGNRRRR
ncbi:MAG TPA: ribonuclease R [Verrucomicrobiae bacterium]